jgi:hypothetical protein
MALDADLARRPVCDLETIGRRSGLPRRIEIWFAADPERERIYVLSGEGRRPIGYVLRRGGRARPVNLPEVAHAESGVVASDLVSVGIERDEQPDRAAVASDRTRCTRQIRIADHLCFVGGRHGTDVIPLTLNERPEVKDRLGVVSSADAILVALLG